MYWLFRRADGWPVAGLVSGAVFSHWILDLIVHRPDLPLYGNGLKVGLGLWNYPIALEILFLFGGMYVYWTTTKPIAGGGRYGMVVFGLVMVAVQAFVFFGPPPTSDRAGALTALALYVLFASVAYWLERKRAPHSAFEEDLLWRPAN